MTGCPVAACCALASCSILKVNVLLSNNCKCQFVDFSGIAVHSLKHVKWLDEKPRFDLSYYDVINYKKTGFLTNF